MTKDRAERRAKDRAARQRRRNLKEVIMERAEHMITKLRNKRKQRKKLKERTQQ